eukprot:NODE_170_length_16226_cov_0.451169.p10 type:complete len:179 gc:universal NODE_170_length_16226_cov_0.451169:14523-15059(+)
MSHTPSVAKRHVILQETLLIQKDMEITIAKPSSVFLRELYPVFNRDTSLFNIVIFILKMENDILNSQSNQQRERDDKLDRLMKMGSDLKKRINDKGYFLDYMDPVSGLAMNSKTNIVYADSSGCESVLKMDVVNIGCCKLISHKKWGTNIYPFTVFTSAPAPLILDSVNEHFFLCESK